MPISHYHCGLFNILNRGDPFIRIVAIALDRFSAVSLHLRYQELVAAKRVCIIGYSAMAHQLDLLTLR